MSIHIHDNYEELRVRCDALRGLLYAECGYELDEIAAVETAALLEIQAAGNRSSYPNAHAMLHPSHAYAKTPQR